MAPTIIPFIHQLPVELLAEIFDFATQCDASDIPSDLETLSLVCKHWKQVTEGTSRFWTMIRTDDPPSCIVKAARLSYPRPLNVELKFFPEDKPCLHIKGKSTDAETRTALASAHRWGTLLVDCQSGDKILPEVVEGEFPELVVLRILCSDECAPVDLLGRRPPPNLQYLTLKRLPIPWDSPLLTSGSLRGLDLAIMPENPPSPSQILHILSACPLLRSLKLTWLYKCDHNFGEGLLQDSTSSQLYLPCLEHVDLYVHVEAITHIITHIDAPNIQLLRLDWSCLRIVDASCGRLLEHLKPILLGMVGDAQGSSVRVDVGVELYNIRLGLRWSRVSLGLKDWMEVALALSTFSPICRPLPASLTVTSYDETTTTLLSTCSRLLPDIRHVVFDVDPYFAEELKESLRSLAKRTYDGSDLFQSILLIEIRHFKDIEEEVMNLCSALPWVYFQLAPSTGRRAVSEFQGFSESTPKAENLHFTSSLVLEEVHDFSWTVIELGNGFGTAILPWEF